MSLWTGLKLILTISCDRASRLLSDERERALSRTERVALQGHLLVCRQCRRFRRNLQHLQDLVRGLTSRCLSGVGRPKPLSPDARARILRAVARARDEDFPRDL